MLSRFLCLLRGGHKWETVDDPAGSFGRRARCGVLRHTRTGVEEKPDEYMDPPRSEV